MKRWTLVGAGLVGLLALGACSGHGGGGVTCQETMPGMQMCNNDQITPAPATAQVPQK